MADLASYVEQAAEEFVKEDNPIVDDYFDKFLGDRYDFHECEWWQMETEPIAWCEIPEYTEE